MKHQYTVELLFHFNCGTCKNWWSYATTPSCLSGSIEYNSLPENIDYYCPHCGAAEKGEIKGGFAGKGHSTHVLFQHQFSIIWLVRFKLEGKGCEGW